MVLVMANSRFPAITHYKRISEIDTKKAPRYSKKYQDAS